MSSKLSIGDGSRRTGLGTGAMTAIKKKSWQHQRVQWKQGSRIYFLQLSRSSSSRADLRFLSPKRGRSNRWWSCPHQYLAKRVWHVHSVTSTTAQQYPVDTIMTITPCLLLYPIGRARKTKEVAKPHVHPARGLFEGKPIPIGYACVQIEQLLKSSYEIDFPTADGKSCLGECVGTTILWHK